MEFLTNIYAVDFANFRKRERKWLRLAVLGVGGWQLFFVFGSVTLLDFW